MCLNISRMVPSHRLIRILATLQTNVPGIIELSKLATNSILSCSCGLFIVGCSSAAGGLSDVQKHQPSETSPDHCYWVMIRSNQLCY